MIMTGFFCFFRIFSLLILEFRGISCIIITDKNNVKNRYRIFINTEFNHIYFQYIDENDGEIIDLTDYLIDENTYDDDTMYNTIILIFSMLNYYMNVLVYSYESE